MTELMTLIIAAAIKARSSDIHIEAEEKDVKVRYRIDGVLNGVAYLFFFFFCRRHGSVFFASSYSTIPKNRVKPTGSQRHALGNSHPSARASNFG